MDIPPDHKAALFLYSETDRIRYFQQGWGGLVVDGIYGTKTAAALDEYIAGVDRPPLIPSLVAVFDSAMLDVGQREDPMGSNSGAYVEGLRVETGLPQLGQGEWCAVFQSAHAMRNGFDIKSRGAPGIVRALIDLPGGREVDVEDVVPGFVGMSLHRRGTVNHHVRIFRALGTVEKMRIEYVGGNEGHMVKSSILTSRKYFRDVLRIATHA